MLGQPSGYMLLELVVLLAVSGILVTTLLTINQTLLMTWNYNHCWVNLQQATRISMNSIIERLQSAVKVKIVEEDKIIFWPPAAASRKIFYQPQVGLCLDSVTNKISQRVTGLKFTRQGSNLLLIKVETKLQDQNWGLTTAIKLEAEQFVN